MFSENFLISVFIVGVVLENEKNFIFIIHIIIFYNDICGIGYKQCNIK